MELLPQVLQGEQKPHRAARPEGLLAAKGLYHLRVQAGALSQLHC